MNNYSFEDSILGVFILIEENNAESTSKAIERFKIIWERETKEKISSKKANIEMRKSYNSYIK